MKKGITKNPGSTIGILSGMGPLAGSDVLRKILAYAANTYGAVEDVEYPDVVLISRGFEGFDAQAAINADLEQKLLNVIQHLNTEGATVIGMACNTAHICLDAIRQNSKVPVANLPQEAAKRAAQHQGNFLLITSHAAREAALYPTAMRALGVDFTELNDQEQQVADEIIELVMAHKLIEAGEKISALVANHIGHFDGIIAGCTELPLAFDFSTAAKGKPYVDSNQVLAEVLVDSCYAVAAQAVRQLTPKYT